MKKYFLLMILVILSLFVFADGGENDGDKTDSVLPFIPQLRFIWK